MKSRALHSCVNVLLCDCVDFKGVLANVAVWFCFFFEWGGGSGLM